MDWEIKETLKVEDLVRETINLKQVLCGKVFIHKNGSKYVVDGISILNKDGKSWYAVNYSNLYNPGITFTRDLNEFLDGRFTEI